MSIDDISEIPSIYNAKYKFSTQPMRFVIKYLIHSQFRMYNRSQTNICHPLAFWTIPFEMESSQISLVCKYLDELVKRITVNKKIENCVYENVKRIPSAMQLFYQ